MKRGKRSRITFNVSRPASTLSPFNASTVSVVRGPMRSLSFPGRLCKLVATVNRALWIWQGLLVAALALGLDSAASAAPKLLLDDLSVRTWTKEDRLPDNSVTAVLQDAGWVPLGRHNGRPGPV